jgi:sugar lactone lactonase YvrE
VATLQLATAGASAFINDVAVTGSTAYFTDSMRSAIYAVDINRLTVRTIALPDIPNDTGFNLNGIVATPDQRALLAVQTNTGKLWRIDPAGGHALVRTIKSRGFDVPTTIAMLHGDLYAVNARFGVADPQKAAYRVTLVRR